MAAKKKTAAKKPVKKKPAAKRPAKKAKAPARPVRHQPEMLGMPVCGTKDRPGSLDRQRGAGAPPPRGPPA